ncbi:hypothetical protein F0P96_14050 [Hymenobacter busanensis]|uniref:Uncharacterized protein n=1 Tax=Hymenobacter busanensis TaxID=2607656 RepID=A0A7L4ZZ45_9BACT|nr:DUF3592 domain-containing protein [Hymenobacter busanensis]KAA9331365.1 hypothetical protein F0P96_14050 [Hymenobacter busanensis]QHJ08518.1 hypothetical protein GUY19_14975 [Hymenobacter busanensis]
MTLHTSSASRHYVLTGYLLTLSGSLLFLILAVSQGRRAYHLSTEGLRTTGLVRSVVADHIAEDEFFRYTIEFVDQAQQRQVILYQGEVDAHEYFLNQPIPVVYLPTRADEGLIDNWMNLYGSALLNLLGLLTTLGMAWYFRSWEKNQQPPKADWAT